MNGAEAMADGEGATSDRPRRAANRNWLWFFIVVIVLAVAGIAINWSYNLRQQLTMEQLDAALALWKEKGPQHYDLTIEKIISSAAMEGEPRRETVEVKVRRGKPLAGTVDGRPIEQADRILPDYDMAGWFDFIREFLERDLAPNAPRTFRRAVFDLQTGALKHFVRRVSGTRERQELAFRVTPVSPP
jgi:hypothetical protein